MELAQSTIIQEVKTNTILQELKTSGRLPSPTGVALTILELTRDPNTSTEDMSSVLGGDPALTGQILKYANAAQGGARGGITSINDALVRLGMSMVRQLSLGFSVLRNSRTGACVVFDYEGYWTHSLAMAASCQVFSKHLGTISAEEGFTCGLLGRIGHLALASVYPEHYQQILEEWDEGSQADLLELENRELGITHKQVSAALFEDWGLPEPYRLAVEMKTRREWGALPTGNSTRDRGYQLSHLLKISHLAADICMETGPQRHPLVLEFLTIGQKLGFDEESWSRIYDEIIADWEHLGKLLNIVTGNVPDMETLIHRARAFKGVIKDKPTRPTLRRMAKPAPPVPSRPNKAAPATGLNILVATDSPVDMHILEKKLTASGHSPSFTQNGCQALEKALREDPQVILTDWQMPEIDGLELTRSLRRSTQTAGTYVIIMTAQDGSTELVEAFDAGIDDYVTKPINYAVLQARLKAAERLVRLQEQAAQDRDELRKTMTEMGILNRKLHTMALEDQLTKIPNRRSGLGHLDKIWSRTSPDQEPLLVMLLDIDHFKRVNDTYGHDIGDIVLRSTAATMQNSIRESDVVCRFGGEEFLVICPGADLEVAKSLANRLRRSVERNTINAPGFQGHVTISIGVAVRGRGHTSSQELIKDADEALYAAKEAGRNLVCIANPE
ncbi:hypothetical protein CSB20_13055 [bacterium DOLZORAL124_64_63]|nr:MAG: hypothetical protein CSB20_13055 [bacterium DOLZORAL124_64_63]